MDASPTIAYSAVESKEALDCTHIEHRKFRQNSSQLLLKRILRKLDFAHIEVPYPTDLEVLVYDL